MRAEDVSPGQGGPAFMNQTASSVLSDAIQLLRQVEQLYG